MLLPLLDPGLGQDVRLALLVGQGEGPVRRTARAAFDPAGSPPLFVTAGLVPAIHVDPRDKPGDDANSVM